MHIIAPLLNMTVGETLNISFHQVPNPLFDLAGILCGQFNIPFWKFFLATLIGKAFIKVYMQVCYIQTCLYNCSYVTFSFQLLYWHIRNPISYK
jgi:uncharacterized membrane protein YdjX (TVP38/TMEM64 family)